MWASSCLLKTSRYSVFQLKVSACRCKGAIFARESISAMPTGVSSVKSMCLQKRGWLSAVSRHRRQTCATYSHAKRPDPSFHAKMDRKENVAARTSQGGREIGE